MFSGLGSAATAAAKSESEAQCTDKDGGLPAITTDCLVYIFIYVVQEGQRKVAAIERYTRLGQLNCWDKPKIANDTSKVELLIAHAG